MADNYPVLFRDDFDTGSNLSANWTAAITGSVPITSIAGGLLSMDGQNTTGANSRKVYMIDTAQVPAVDVKGKRVRLGFQIGTRTTQFMQVWAAINTDLTTMSGVTASFSSSPDYRITRRPTNTSSSSGTAATLASFATTISNNTDYIFEIDDYEVVAATSSRYIARIRNLDESLVANSTIDSGTVSNANTDTGTYPPGLSIQTSTTLIYWFEVLNIKAPNITTQPTNQSEVEGTTATFTITAEGGAAGTSPTTQTDITYQWQVDDGGGWANVSTGTGGTTNSYTTGTLALSDNGNLYRCVITDTGNSNTNTSSEVELDVQADDAITYYPDDALLFFSPYNWVETGSGASSTALTPNTGAYVKFGVLVGEGGSGTVVLHADPSILPGTLTAAQLPYLKTYVDGIVEDNPLQLVSGTTDYEVIAGLSPGLHTIEIFFRSITFTSPPNRWDDSTDIYAVKLTGFTISGNSTMVAATLRPKRLLCISSSSFEGAYALGSGTAIQNHDATLAYSMLLSASEYFNAEIGVVGWSSQGYAVGGLGSVPAMVSGSTWDNITSTVSRTISPAPDYLLFRLGGNDAGNYSANVTTMINNLRAACGEDTWLFWLIPYYDNDSPTPTQIGYTTGPVDTLVAAGDDRLAYLEAYTPTGTYNNGHPTEAFHIELAPFLWGQINPLISGGGSSAIGPGSGFSNINKGFIYGGRRLG